MTALLALRRIDKAQLTQLVVNQLKHFVPDGLPINQTLIHQHLPQSLERLRVCINAVRWWKENEFDHLHSSQYCIFLYYLANTIWKETDDNELPTKLFILNKALNGIDLFYEISMPVRFFIGHSAGVVLAKACYADYLVLYQNSTVGKNHGVSPVIDYGVIMYPNTAIIGRCIVRAGTVISQGTSIVNQDSPGNCLVFRGPNQSLIYKPLARDILSDIFRI
jgi:serine O-acetyltransferase